MRKFLLAVYFLFTNLLLHGQQKYKVNYDEEKIPHYSLEDPLTFADGRKVSKFLWPKRREEILRIFQQEMYGQLPPVPDTIVTETIEEGMTMAGHAIRKQVRMWFRADKSGPSICWLVLIPTSINKPVPVVMMLNYFGNHTVIQDEEVQIPDFKYHAVIPHSPKERGMMLNQNSRSIIPIPMIIGRGYAFVTACYEDISPDPDGRDNQDRYAYTRIFDLWGPRNNNREDNTTSLMAWAWGLMRGMDMIVNDSFLDEKKVLLTGSSRLGKAALIAGAYDERFSVVVPNQTGKGGTPLNKRYFGENVEVEIHSFSHWYCRSYYKYENNETTMPFDQHLLLACIAPRALMVQGFDEPWFDTKGEFLALQAASPVWEMLGKKGLPKVDYPSDYDSSAIGLSVAYYHRPLEHGISAFDWQKMLDFAHSNWSVNIFKQDFD